MDDEQQGRPIDDEIPMADALEAVKRAAAAHSCEKELAMRAWRCKRGHVMGMMYREDKIDKLRPLSDIRIVIIGEAEIECPECREIRTWYPGEEAIKRLIQRVLSAGARVFRMPD